MSMIRKLLVLGGAFMHLPHEMFPSIMNTSKDIPVPPKRSTANWQSSPTESNRRHQAAIDKRQRRAEKLRRLEERNAS